MHVWTLETCRTCDSYMCVVRWGKFVNFNELYNMNKLYVLQNEILISHKTVTIPYYLLQLQKCV